MKKIKIVVTAVIISIFFSLLVFSQLNPVVKVSTKKTQVTPKIGMEQKETCTTEFYNDIEQIKGVCTYYYNYTHCINSSGQNTGCSTQQTTQELSCIKEERPVLVNRTTCRLDDKFIVSIDKGLAVLKKQIDFSDWGPCIYRGENGCLAVECVSYYDGAHNGEFIDCKGGKSCQRFEICDNGVKTFYKNSRESFAEEDSTFYLDKLSLEEVPQ